jgi:hypothetical protein
MDASNLFVSEWLEISYQTLYHRFLRAKAPVAYADLEAVVRIGLDVVLQTPDNLFIQVCDF